MARRDRIAFTSLFALSLCFASTMGLPDRSGAAESPPKESSRGRGDAAHGRALFNGKGVCYYCHGMDGNLGQPAQLSPETAALIARLVPKPSDLRARARLHLRSDRERFRVIREGHTGTAMFPDTTLTDDEISDLLAYLAALRGNISRQK